MLPPGQVTAPAQYNRSALHLNSSTAMGSDALPSPMVVPNVASTAQGHFKEIVSNWPAAKDAKIMVLTDGGRILGLGVSSTMRSQGC